MAQVPPHEVLSKGLERLEQGVSSVDELIAQHPELRDELAALVGLAQRLRSLPPPVTPARLRADPLWRRGLPAAVAGPPPRSAPEPRVDSDDPAAADLLAACLAAQEDPAGDAAALLAQQPALHDEVAPLLAIAASLRDLPAVRAPDRLRQRPAWREAVASEQVPSPPAPLRMPDREAADVLAACLESPERVAETLALNPGVRDEVAPLVALAHDLEAAPRVRAPASLRAHPAWREGLEVTAAAAPALHLVRPDEPTPVWAAAQRDLEARPRVQPRRGQAWGEGRSLRMAPWSRIAAGVGGATFALLLAGTVATSATSLPDEPLYPVKRLVEDAQLAVAPADSRLELHLRRAEERLKETREMIERDRPEVVASLADAWVREVEALRQELSTERAQPLPQEQVARVVNRVSVDRDMLSISINQVAAPARPKLERAVEVSKPESVAPIASSRSEPPSVSIPAPASDGGQQSLTAPPPSFGGSTGSGAVILPPPNAESRTSGRVQVPAASVPSAFTPIDGRTDAVAPPAAAAPAIAAPAAPPAAAPRVSAPVDAPSLLPNPGSQGATAPQPQANPSLRAAPPASSPPSQSPPVGGPAPAFSVAPAVGAAGAASGPQPPAASVQAPAAPASAVALPAPAAPAAAPAQAPPVGVSVPAGSPQILPPAATPTRATGVGAPLAPPVGSPGR